MQEIAARLLVMFCQIKRAATLLHGYTQGDRTEKYVHYTYFSVKAG